MAAVELVVRKVEIFHVCEIFEPQRLPLLNVTARAKVGCAANLLVEPDDSPALPMVEELGGLEEKVVWQGPGFQTPA